MTSILRRLPFHERADAVAVGLERVRVRPCQMIVWVNAALKGVLDLPPHAPRFPALLDTGHNHNFSIRRDRLRRWAGVDPTIPPICGAMREGGRRAEVRRLNVWLHPNEAGQRDAFADRPPFCLELPEGIAVYPDEGNHPSLPLLGLRGLVRNKLHVTIDAARACVEMRSPDWRTRLQQWLS